MSQLLIQHYLNDLQTLRRVSGTSRESVVREAFKTLLKDWGKSRRRGPPRDDRHTADTGENPTPARTFGARRPCPAKGRSRPSSTGYGGGWKLRQVATPAAPYANRKCDSPGGAWQLCGQPRRHAPGSSNATIQRSMVRARSRSGAPIPRPRHRLIAQLASCGSCPSAGRNPLLQQ